MNLRVALAAALSLVTSLKAVAAEPPKPIDRSGRTQVGVGSFYGKQEAGKQTASGAPMKPDELTAASRTLPLGTQAKVVTPKAANALGMTKQGVANVEVHPLKEPPPAPK